MIAQAGVDINCTRSLSFRFLDLLVVLRGSLWLFKIKFFRSAILVVLFALVLPSRIVS